MTISTQVYKDTYIADGIEDTFAFSFPILDEDHILVQIVNSTGTLQVQTAGIHYTVSGTGNTENRTNYTSGSVIFETAYIPEEDETVIIKRDIPLTQETLYIENDTFPAKTHEEALDKLTLITQQLQEQIDRRFGTDYTGEDSTDFSLPPPVANEYIRFNSTATGLESITLNSVTGIDNVVDDPSPELGGNLDVNGNQIVSVSNNDITIQPHGTGKINLLSDALLVETEIAHYGDTNNRIIFGTDTQDYRTGGSTRLDISDLGVRLGNANARVTTILDESDMASNSSAALATQQSTKTYVDNTTVNKTTPVLGGNLDVATYDIVTTSSNRDIDLDPHGAGNINLNVASGGSINLNGGDVYIAGDIIHTSDVDSKIAVGTDTWDIQTGGSSRLDVSNSGVRIGGTNARVTTILDEDAMGSDSATALATQQSIKAYVDSKGATQAQQEAGTSTSVYVTPSVQKNHPSAAKAWVMFNSAGSIDASYNVSSVNKASSDFTINFTNALSSGYYCVVCSVSHSSSTDGNFKVLTQSNSSVGLRLTGISTTSLVSGYAVIFGDF